MQCCGRCAALHRPAAAGLVLTSAFKPTPSGRIAGRLHAAATPASSEAPAAQHVTVVGGGAAGLTAAFFAAEYGARVTVLERTRECGKKVLMSGGSRCNVLPFEVDLAQDFFTESPYSAFKAVASSWNLDLCRQWLEDPYWGVGLDLQLEEVGRAPHAGWCGRACDAWRLNAARTYWEVAAP